MGSAKQQLKLDNARVNRADEKCKLVKTGVGYNGRSRPSDDKSNTKPENASVQRFVIPAADVLRALILPVQPNEVEHVFALDRAYQSEIAERITRSIEAL